MVTIIKEAADITEKIVITKGNISVKTRTDKKRRTTIINTKRDESENAELYKLTKRKQSKRN